MMEGMLALLDAGALVCPINWRWTPGELADAMRRVSPSVVLYDQSCMELTLAAVEQLYGRARGVREARAGGSCSDRGGQEGPRASAPHLVAIDHGHGAITSGCAAASSQLLTNGASASCPAAPPTTASAGGPTTATPTAASTSALIASAPLAAAPAPSPHAPCPLQLLLPPCGTAMLVFTSGTTSAPKAVMLPHAAFHAQSLVKLATVRTTVDDTYLHLAPLFHIGGLSSAFAALMAGSTHVFMPRFAPGAALRAVAQLRVTSFIAVPAMLEDLAAAVAARAAAAAAAAAAPATSAAATASASAAATNATPGVSAVAGPPGAGAAGAGAEDLDLRCVRRILVGAGGTSPRLQDAVRRTFPRAELLSAYGMTEACSSMTFMPLRAPSSAPSSTPSSTPSGAPSGAPSSSSAAGAGGSPVGWPAPGVQVAVVPSAELGPPAGAGAAAASGCVGEVLTRGPHVMSGYWGDPAATEQAFAPGGWLRTGDLGRLRADGCLLLLGRAKDMVKSGGENVFAPQVEGVLVAHPAVAAAAVVGLPDERLGEQVAALVVLRPGWSFAGPSLPQHSSTSAGGSAHAAAPAAPGQGSAAGSSSTSSSGGGGGDGGTTSLADLQAFCRQRGLAGFRLPRFAAAQHAPLPVNGSGKVQKPAVREALLRAREAAAPRSRL